MKLRLMAIISILFLIAVIVGNSQDFAVGPDIEEAILLVETKSGIRVRPRTKDVGIEILLANVKFIPHEKSPNWFTVSGRVISDNARIPKERIWVYVGRKGSGPVLAGLTNADGDFKFRLRVGDEVNWKVPQVDGDLNGYLYLGEWAEDFAEQEATLLRYDLSKLKTLADEKNGKGEQSGAPN